MPTRIETKSAGPVECYRGGQIVNIELQSWKIGNWLRRLGCVQMNSEMIVGT